MTGGSDLVALVAAAVSVCAAAYSLHAAKRARRAMGKALASSNDSADIAVRAINAQEVLTLTQRRMARTIDALLEEASEATRRWEIAHDSGPMFRLSNVSTEPEQDVRVMTVTGSRILEAPDGATIEPGTSVRFGLPTGGWGLDRPDDLLVRSAAHPDVVKVPIPWPDR